MPEPLDTPPPFRGYENPPPFYSRWGVSKGSAVAVLAFVLLWSSVLLGCALMDNAWAQRAIEAVWGAVGWKLGMVPPG